MSFSDFYTFFLIHYFEGKERYWSDFQFTASSMCFISRGTNNISMLKDQKSWRPVDQYSIPCTYTPKLIIVSKRDGVTEINFLKSEILVCHRIRYCLSLDGGLANAYDCLQGLCRRMRVEDTFAKCLENVRFVARKLENCRCDVLSKVAATYRKWEVEIARGLAKNEFGVVLSNAKIEAGNDVAQTMIDAAYGYRNFERFRKRFLLMRWNAKR